MAIDAIVANMDPVWNANQVSGKSQTRSYTPALERFLQDVRAKGFPLLLMSDMKSADLNRAIHEQLGEEGINYFSSILPSEAAPDLRYAMALHTLGTQADRIVAVGVSQHHQDEARDSGITRWVHLADVLSSDDSVLSDKA